MRIAGAPILLIIVAITGLFAVHPTWAGPDKPTPAAPDPVEDAKQVEALLDQRDQKMLAQLRANRQNEILYYRGRKRSEILKALGLSSPAAPASRPAPKPANDAAAPALPIGPCAAGVDPLLIRRNRLDTFQLRGRPVPSPVPRERRSESLRTVSGIPRPHQ